MTTPSIDDDLHRPSIDAGLGVEDMASLVFVLLMLKCQDLGDNESGARILITKDLIIFIVVHAPVDDHLLKGFHFLFTHGVIGSVVVEDHGALVGTHRMMESIQETCHSLLIIFRDIGSYHGNLHFFVVFFNALCSLFEKLEFLEKVAVVVGWRNMLS